ncbi:MAG: transaldolase family protein [Dehalococcoidia bacterium]
MTTTGHISVNGVAESPGSAAKARLEGRGPAIWLAGDPEDLKDWLPLGAAGIVTNTVVLNDMVKKYGQVTEVTKRYLDITDLPVVIEIDGHSTQELLDVGEVFTRMSDQVILKIPCTVHGLGAFRELSKAGVETFCTTTFTLAQAAAVAQAGATHVLPFCEPYRDVSGDPTKLIRECRTMFDGWAQRPFITAALVRTVDTAHAALRDGADGIIVFWPVFRDMMKNKLTDEWNQTFLDNWNQMYDAGLMNGVPVQRAN